MRFGFIVSVVLLWAGLAQANVLTNGSFEDSPHSSGWSLTGGSISAYGSSTYNGGASDGTWAVIMNAGNNVPSGTLSQAFTTTIGQKYRLSFDIGKYHHGSGIARVEAVVTGSTTLLSELAEDAIASGGENDPLEAPDFETYVFDFVADSTSTTLTINDTSTNGGVGFDLVLDDFVVTAIPEPSVIGLLSLGMAGLCARRPRG